MQEAVVAFCRYDIITNLHRNQLIQNGVRSGMDRLSCRVISEISTSVMILTICS